MLRESCQRRSRVVKLASFRKKVESWTTLLRRNVCKQKELDQALALINFPPGRDHFVAFGIGRDLLRSHFDRCGAATELKISPRFDSVNNSYTPYGYPTS